MPYLDPRSKPFVPSSRDLEAMIESAMRRADADREQALLQKEHREDERITRAWAAEADAKRRRALHGP